VSTAVRNQEQPPFAGGAITVATAEQLAQLAENGQATVGQPVPVPVNGTKFGHCPQCDEDGQG
jgi:hypothetical protein